MDGGGGPSGVLWSGAGEDLNVNLVELSPGAAVGRHVNAEVDVVLVGLSGAGVVETGNQVGHAPAATYALGPNVLVEIPKGFERSVAAAGDRPLRYLSIHRRRQLRIGASRG